jgi:hypothetical protein
VRSTGREPRRPTSSTTTPKGTGMSATTDQLTYAVMQDNSVLCGDCATEVCDELHPAEATLVHAWLTPDPTHSCSRCGASGDPIGDER